MVIWMAHRMIWRNPGNPENVAYVYWNDDRWIQDWNWLDNDWNDNDRLLRRKSLRFNNPH